MSRDKLTETCTVRLPSDFLDTLDVYQRAREREARVPLSRAIVLRELLELGMAANAAGWTPKRSPRA